jgi:hypothetical protein
MGASELETVVRLRLPMLVVVYNDAAYGGVPSSRRSGTDRCVIGGPSLGHGLLRRDEALGDVEWGACP